MRRFIPLIIVPCIFLVGCSDDSNSKPEAKTSKTYTITQSKGNSGIDDKTTPAVENPVQAKDEISASNLKLYHDLKKFKPLLSSRLTDQAVNGGGAQSFSTASPLTGDFKPQQATSYTYQVDSNKLASLELTDGTVVAGYSTYAGFYLRYPGGGEPQDTAFANGVVALQKQALAYQKANGMPPIVGILDSTFQLRADAYTSTRYPLVKVPAGGNWLITSSTADEGSWSYTVTDSATGDVAHVANTGVTYDRQVKLK